MVGVDFGEGEAGAALACDKGREGGGGLGQCEPGVGLGMSASGRSVESMTSMSRWMTNSSAADGRLASASAAAAAGRPAMLWQESGGR